MSTWKISLGTASSTSSQQYSQPRVAERRGFSFPKIPKDDPPVGPEPYSVNDGEPGAVENGPAHLSIPESGFHKPTPTPTSGPDDPMVIPSPKPSATPVLDPNDIPQPDLPDSSSTLTALSASLTAPSPARRQRHEGDAYGTSANTTVTSTSAKFPTLGDGTPFTGSGIGNMKVSLLCRSLLHD